jgi:hypothetical protein
MLEVKLSFPVVSKSVWSDLLCPLNIFSGSFIFRKNESGPKTDPYGTSCSTFMHDEV